MNAAVLNFPYLVPAYASSLNVLLIIRDTPAQNPDL